MNAAFDLRGFIENSLLEWENHLAAVVIAGGCNLRCPYCHSWRYVTGLSDLESLNPQAVFDLLERQKGWIDGVVFTGGEPTLQPGLAEMIAKVREYGVKIKLHTNGTKPEVVRELLAADQLDCLALDYKAPLDDRFYAATGIASSSGLADAVKETFCLAAESGIDREYHTTLVPKFVDKNALTDMANSLAPGGLWILQQFEDADCLDPGMSGTVRYSNAELEELKNIAAAKHERVLLKKKD